MQCSECGFEWEVPDGDDIPGRLRESAADVVEAFRTVSDVVTRRSPDVWSPLEYLCHVRDVLIVQRERVLLAQWSDRPALQPMGRDERVELDGYAAQDPGEVEAEVSAAARRLAHVLSRFDDAGWKRTVMYNYPHPAERTVRWVAVNTLHELVHHAGDIRRQG